MRKRICFTPTPQEIADACREIQESWTFQERNRRRAEETRAEPPMPHYVELGVINSGRGLQMGNFEN